MPAVSLLDAATLDAKLTKESTDVIPIPFSNTGLRAWLAVGIKLLISYFENGIGITLTGRGENVSSIPPRLWRGSVTTSSALLALPMNPAPRSQMTSTTLKLRISLTSSTQFNSQPGQYLVHTTDEKRQAKL